LILIRGDESSRLPPGRADRVERDKRAELGNVGPRATTACERGTRSARLFVAAIVRYRPEDLAAAPWDEYVTMKNVAAPAVLQKG